MAKNYFLFTFIIFIIKNSLLKAGTTNDIGSVNDDQLIKGYNILFNLIKCEYANEDRALRGFVEVDKGNCAQIQEELLEIISNPENENSFRELLNQAEMEKTLQDYRENSNKIKQVVNIMEFQARDISFLKALIDNLRENKAVLLVQRENNPATLSFTNTWVNLTNNPEYGEGNENLITENLVENQKDIQELEILFKLKNALDNINNENEPNINKTRNYELGSFNVSDFLNNGIKDMLTGNNLNAIDLIKKNLGEDNVVANELINLMEKKKEIGETIKSIQKDIKENVEKKLDTATLNKLGELKAELGTHQVLVQGLLGVLITELKELLLKALYKAYSTYRKKKAICDGTSDIQFPEHIDINDMKKGIIEIGVRLLFAKIKALLNLIKRKIFKKKENPKLESRNYILGSNGIELNENLNNLQTHITDNDIVLLKQLDNMINEIDYYSRKYEENEVEVFKTVTPETVEPAENVTEGQDVNEEVIENNVEQLTNEVVENIVGQDVNEEILETNEDTQENDEVPENNGEETTN